VLWDLALNPVKESIDMECVIRDVIINRATDSCDLGEVARGKALARWTADNVISGMLIRVSSVKACFVGDLKNGVNTKTLMGVQIGALAIDKSLREDVWVDSAGKELGGVVLLALIICDYQDAVKSC
jgi:hypothetical protein